MKKSDKNLLSNTGSFDNFVEIIRTLRGPNGCPWDKEQTHKSLCRFAIEEVYELIEAIQYEQDELICEELGDVLLQVVLHSVIGEQENRFKIEDVVKNISEKMIRRHPHVFADTRVNSTAEVAANWQRIKDQEKASKKDNITTKKFEFPKGMPPLLRAIKFGEKTNKYRFDWKDAGSLFEKIEEEISELKQAVISGDFNDKKHELGDALFSLAQLGRHLNIDPEIALREANQRIEDRFFQMVGELSLEDFANLSDDKKNELWENVKYREVEKKKKNNNKEK